MKAPAFLPSRALISLMMLSAPVALSGGAAAQEVGPGKWAEENDPVAKMLIEQERKWGTLSCTPSNVIAEFIADDFVGTHPKGHLYTKADMAPRDTAPATPTETDCKLLSAKVRYFGPDVAVIYGSESAVSKGPDGKDMTRTLVWTDTVMRRAGHWQVIAVQDMTVPSK